MPEIRTPKPTQAEKLYYLLVYGLSPVLIPLVFNVLLFVVFLELVATKSSGVGLSDQAAKDFMSGASVGMSMLLVLTYSAFTALAYKLFGKLRFKLFIVILAASMVLYLGVQYFVCLFSFLYQCNPTNQIKPRIFEFHLAILMVFIFLASFFRYFYPILERRRTVRVLYKVFVVALLVGGFVYAISDTSALLGGRSSDAVLLDDAVNEADITYKQGRYLYVIHEEGSMNRYARVLIYNLDTLEPFYTLIMGPSASGVYAVSSEDGKFLYVINSVINEDSKLAIINTKKHAVVKIINIWDVLSGGSKAPFSIRQPFIGGDYLFVPNKTDRSIPSKVALVNTQTFEVENILTDPLPEASRISAMTSSLDGRYLIYTYAKEDRLVKLDLQTGEVVKEVAIELPFFFDLRVVDTGDEEVLLIDPYEPDGFNRKVAGESIKLRLSDLTKVEITEAPKSNTEEFIYKYGEQEGEFVFILDKKTKKEVSRIVLPFLSSVHAVFEVVNE